MAPSRPADTFPRQLAFALLPVISTVLLLPALVVLFGPLSTLEGLRLTVLSCLDAGRVVVLDAGAAGRLEPFVLAAGVFYVDLCFAFPLAYNLEVLHRLPYAGAPLRLLEKLSRRFLHHSPVGKALTWLGLVLFVALPLGGTGAVGGAFFGRLSGLSRSRTLSGIAVGSLLGNAGLAFGAHLKPMALKRFLEHPVLGAIGAGVALAVVGVLIIRLRASRH